MPELQREEEGEGRETFSIRGANLRVPAVRLWLPLDKCEKLMQRRSLVEDYTNACENSKTDTSLCGHNTTQHITTLLQPSSATFVFS